MTTTQAPPTAAPPRRAALIALAATGPLAIAALRAVLPYDTTDDGATVLARVAEHPGAQTLVLGLAYLALLTLPIGVAVTGWVAARARPVLGTVAAVAAWVGFLSLFAGGALDALALAAARTRVPVESTAALAAELEALPILALPTLVFVVGHILGAVLLGIALWGVVPRWAAAGLVLSQPLHLVFAVVVPHHLLDALAWILTAAGFAAAAATRGVLR